MEEDDFDGALAELDIPELQSTKSSSSSTGVEKSLSQKVESSEEKIQDQIPEEVANEKPSTSKTAHSSNAIIVNSKQRGKLSKICFVQNINLSISRKSNFKGHKQHPI